MSRHQPELSKAHYDRVKEIITRRTGLVFPKRREAELRQTLEETVAEFAPLGDAEKFIEELEGEVLGRASLRRLTARLTVGETYFFRNKPQFDLLRESILPELVRTRGETSRAMRLWSAGCSSGEEAYSLAILLAEIVPNLSQWNIFILATDINEEALKVAAEGAYREWSFRDVPPGIKERYFTRLGKDYLIAPHIRRMVTFRYLNLTEETYPLHTTGTALMDVILCRNVMIYFQPALSQAITRRFWRALNPGGYLIVGHTEHSGLVFSEFKKVISSHTLVYRKEERESVLDRGLRLRFRGSGVLPPNVVPTMPPKQWELPAEEPPPDRFDLREETRLFEEGARSYSEGHQRAALDKFKAVLAINPVNHRALYLLALIEANRDHIERAEEYCRQSLGHNPLSLEASYLMAIIAREKLDAREELECLKKVLYLNHDFVLGHFQMANHYLRQGNPALAGRYFRNALKLLDSWSESDYIEGTEGMTVGRLRESINQYLQQIESEGGRVERRGG